MDIHHIFMYEFEQLENHRRLRLEYRLLRDSSNSFQIADEKFIKIFRLPKILVLNLIEEMQGFDENPLRQTKIPFHLKVLASLNFYGSGMYQTGVGQDLNLAMSQPSISRCVSQISAIFTYHLLRRYVKFPVSEIDVTQTKQRFEDILNFPNTIGAIDCTHIAIIAPKVNDVNPPIAYLNRKGYFSINVQAICDSNMQFLNVNARYPGATHDAAIWEVSTIHRHLQRRYELGERNTWLIGDSGYPLQPWIMTPIPDAPPASLEGIYTSRHTSARNVIERSFGVLKNRFRCLLKHRVLHYSHSRAGQIIYACVILHNICRLNNIPDVEENEDQNHNNYEENEIHAQVAGNQLNVLEEGRLIRRQLINWIRNH